MNKIRVETEHDEEFYNLKTIQCGDSIEIYKYETRGIRLGKITRDKEQEEEREKIERTDEEKLEIRKCYLNKAKNKIARIVKCNADMIFF